MMKTETQAVCGLCFKITNVPDCQLPDETLFQMLEGLHLHIQTLKLTHEDPTVCNICVEKMKGAYQFKVRFLKREKSRMSSKTSQMACRFCQKFVSANSAVILGEMLKNSNLMQAFQSYLPEIDLEINENALICEHCQASLTSFSNFVFLLADGDIEQEQNKYIDQLIHFNVYSQPENNIFIKNKDKIEKALAELIEISTEEVGKELSEEDIYTKAKMMGEIRNEGNSYVIDDSETKIKSDMENENYEETSVDSANFNDETVEIKLEGDIMTDDNDRVDSKQETESDNAFKDTEVKNEVNNEDFECTDLQLKHEVDIKPDPEEFVNDWSDANETLDEGGNSNTTSKKNKAKDISPQQIEMLPVNNDNLIENLNCQVRQHVPTLNFDQTEKFICRQCGFQTKGRLHLRKHMKTHEKGEMHKCSHCNYQSKHKKIFDRHIRSHKNPDELEIHKCPQCTYQTVVKSRLKKHMIVHKKPDEIQMYKCQQCPYESKFKSGLKEHMIKHKSLDEVELYKCEECGHTTRYKQCIKIHMITHKSIDEVKMYPCDQCTFQTKVKCSLKLHMLTHKSPDEIEMHKCQHCSFQSKHKKNLQQHMRSHKVPDSVEVLQCPHCPYKTNIKSWFDTHLLVHKRPIEDDMPRSQPSTFLTNFKDYLKKNKKTYH